MSGPPFRRGFGVWRAKPAALPTWSPRNATRFEVLQQFSALIAATRGAALALATLACTSKVREVVDNDDAVTDLLVDLESPLDRANRLT